MKLHRNSQTTRNRVFGISMAGCLAAVMTSVLVATPGPNLDELIDRLTAVEARDRAMAACQIGDRSSRDVSQAAPKLLAMLGDGSPVEGRLCRTGWNSGGWQEKPSSPGREAAIALEGVGTAVIDPLMGVLRSANAVARENSAFALGLIESEGAIDPLIAVLGDKEAPVRTQAAWALGMIEHASAVQPLGRIVQEDGAAEVREQAAWALGMIEASSAVTPLEGALQDTSADVREQAAWALGMIEDSRATEALTKALQDEDSEVRKQVLWALTRCIDHDDANLDYPELAEQLRQALKVDRRTAQGSSE